MRLDKPTGTIVRQERPMGLLCGEEFILCGSEVFACGGGYVIPRISKVVGVPSRETKPTNEISRVIRLTGTIVRQSEVV